jgi:hypothetical protein
MDVLRISPPFSYTYQCGSTLLTAYLPVYMYSISLQILSVMAKLTFIFSSNLAEYPEWLMRLFPAVYWPVLLRDRHTASLTVNKEKNWDEDGLTRLQDRPSIRLIRPYQILSSAMNNVILLLSFGLCSPILCCYITLNLSLTLCSWLMLIGRFVSVHLDLALVPSQSHPSLPHLGLDSEVMCQDPDQKPRGEEIEGSLMGLLNQQLGGSVHAAFLVCKWPITLTSCFFITLLCWEMAGDRRGWSHALWVPIVGFVMVLILWLWDRALVSGLVINNSLEAFKALELATFRSSFHPSHPSLASRPSSSSETSDQICHL